MTQEVQPLTWSKRTNIEEHQQFFSKINEIIGNLAPTVDEAEQAIAQATAAIASANDAVATANTASAAASAAASQAQTAASTVAGYDGRLTAAEGDIDSLQTADQTMTGNISALGTRMSAAESKNSQQDTSIAALQTADGQNVKINDINQYAVGLTGNQGPIAGMKIFSADMQLSTVMNRQFQIKATGMSTKTSVPSSQSDLSIGFLAGDNSEIANLIVGTTTNGGRLIRIILNGTGGHQAAFNLVSIQPDGTIKYPWS